MKKIYGNKLFIAIVSLIISAAFWIYVTSQESEEFKQTFKGVRVELVGESVLKDNKNLVVTDLSTNTVSIEVVGPRRIVASLSTDSLVAQIDVSKLSQAAYTSLQYSVSFPNGTDTSNITIKRKVPETVNFTVSKLNSKSIPVKGVFAGSVAEGYTAQPEVFEPAEIVVSGPDAYLKNIQFAYVDFGSAEVSSTYSVETGYTLMTDMETEADTQGVTCNPDVVKATLPILQMKELPLTVNLIYGAGANESNTKLSIVPGEITLAGDSAVLASMNNIPIATIDLTEFNSTYTNTHSINFDNSLINISGITEAEVKVEIVGLENKNFTVRNLQCRGVPEGYVADVVSKAITVRLRGTAEALESLRADDILAYADITNYEIATGSHIIPVKIQVDGSTEVGAIGGPYSISVEIRKAEETAPMQETTEIPAMHESY